MAQLAKPVHSPMFTVAQIQKKLREELESLKPSAKETRTSFRLLKKLEACKPRSREGLSEVQIAALDLAAARCQMAVDRRLKGIRKSGTTPTATQQRDLMIIIVFGVGKVSTQSRFDACSVINLQGAERYIRLIHEAFPGLVEAINRCA